MKYIVFDVETPNARNDRMSAIGLCIVENGVIGEQFYTLVNPETYFNSFNIALTGISEKSVINAPTFPEIWEEIKKHFDSGILVAHNAPFDMGVLSKCLVAYGISWKPSVEYACTCRMARRAFPELPSKKLNVLCEIFGIALDHHNAMSDALACAELILRYEKLGISPASFVKEYRLS